MPKAYAIATNITSATGLDTGAHWASAMAMQTSIKRYEDAALSAAPFMASRLSEDQWNRIHTAVVNTGLSPFERLAAFSADSALKTLPEQPELTQTAFILATTKGNIELLGKAPGSMLTLNYSARKVADQLGIPGEPFVISLACVSGVVALQYALRLLQSGRYRHAVVTGCDRFSKFVLSGFQSFQAISDEPCRPFDSDRKGITLGEAAATIVLSADSAGLATGELITGATSNDANHISGPSRTGEELAIAISRTLKSASVAPSDIGFISAHGTATIYNDEMEAKAFHLAGLKDTPVHSYKGYVGHTLGAAGVIESAMTLESMRHKTLIPSIRFETSGTTKQLNVTRSAEYANVNYALKTASGFGGCNATILWKRM